MKVIQGGQMTEQEQFESEVKAQYEGLSAQINAAIEANKEVTQMQIIIDMLINELAAQRVNTKNIFMHLQRLQSDKADRSKIIT